MTFPQFSDIKERWLLPFLVISAFFFRLYLVSHTYVIAKDGILYIELARLISQGKMGAALNLYPLNLYPFIIAIFQKGFHDWEFSAQLISALFGSLAIIPFYYLVKRLCIREVAFVSSILFVVHPYLVRLSAEVIRGPAFWFFFLMSLWFGWEAITRKRPLLFFLTSFSGIMAFVLRPEGIFVLPIVALWAVLKDLKAFKETYKQRLLFVFILLFMIPLLLFPAMLYLNKKTGQWPWARIDEIMKKAAFDLTMHELNKNFDRIELKPLGKSQMHELELLRLKNFLTMARHHRFAVVGIEAVSKYLKALHPFLFVLLLFGAIKRKRIPYQKSEEVFLFSLLAVFILISARYGTTDSYIQTRHMMVPAILSLPWVGAGVLELDYRIKKTSLLAPLTATKGVIFRNLQWILLTLIIFALIPKTISSQRTEKVPIKKAGIWIKEHGPRNPVIMTQGKLGKRIAFYADGTFLEIPRNQELFEVARENRVKFLAINEKDYEKLYPDLIRALNPERFKEEVVIGKPSGRYVIRIYSVRH